MISTRFSPTGIRDLDRELLFYIPNDELMKACNLNSYFKNDVCDENFFKRRTEHFFPHLIHLKKDKTSWRNFFLDLIRYVFKLKENFGYIYNYNIPGNPKTQFSIFRRYSDYPNKFLFESSADGQLALVIEAVNRGANIRALDDLAVRWASENGYLEVVKYLVSLGADIHAQNDQVVISASEGGHLEVVKYLKSLP